MFKKDGFSSSCSLSPDDNAFLYHGISPGERVGVRGKEKMVLSQIDHFWPKLKPRPVFLAVFFVKATAIHINTMYLLPLL